MNHRIVTAVVALILFVFVGTALAFAWSVQVRVPTAVTPARPPLIPHPVDQATADCRKCHSEGTDTIPVTHRHFPNSSCRSCHGWEPIASVSHSMSMGDARCVLCHGDPSLDHGMPKDHLSFRDRRCGFCHVADKGKAEIEPKPAGESARAKPPIPHPVAGAFENCLQCHRANGKPSLPGNHEAFEQETCLWCHTLETSASVSP